jgi:TRAP transporter TAXI family solute receptor
MGKLRTTLEQYWFWLAVVFIVLIVLGILYLLIGVRPSKEFTIATGHQGGAYYAYAQEFQRRFAEQGYTLNIRETAGGVETIDLLEKGEADVGFVQNTTVATSEDSQLTTLAALYYEALWIFYRKDLGIEPNRISDLQGLRINIVETGSSSYIATLGLLNMNGVNSDNSTISTMPEGEAAQLLRDGEIDVVMTFLGAVSPLVHELAATPGVKIGAVSRAESYASLYKNLAAVTLPEGILDFAADIPPQDTPLLATRATLVAGPTLHPDLANLFVIFSEQINGHGGIFEEPGEFPSPTTAGIPMNPDTERYMNSGPTFLEQYVPLSLASRLERFFLLILPIALIAYPAIRGLLALSHTYYTDRIKWRYRALRSIDRDYKSYDEAQLKATIDLLNSQQETLATDMSVPTTMLDEVYNLHYHTSLVLDRLNARLAVVEQEQHQTK